MRAIKVYKSILLFGLVLFSIKGSAQVPSTRETIQGFIDSIGRSNDRHQVTASIFPSAANGRNYNWRINIWRNAKQELLWVETIIPDSLSSVYFYCRDTMIFASELIYTRDTVSNKSRPLFRNIFFYQDSIIEDTAPGRNNNKTDHYINESRDYLELSKKDNLNLGIIEFLNRGIIPDKKEKRSKHRQ